MTKGENDYGISPEKGKKQISAPPIAYLPKKPVAYNPPLGIIGAGGISELHLKNYKACGFNVVALADHTVEKATRRRDALYPKAEVYEDYKLLLQRNDIEVVDITPHPADRVPIVREALMAGKHVLSQKPFVLDLDVGQELIDIANEHKVKLAVNQNGRWAPHFSYMREAITTGLIGTPLSIDFSLQWDQTWISGNPAFEKLHHLVLYDFAIHWFDVAACFMQGQKALSVYAAAVNHPAQRYTPPALASAIINYESAQVRMAFNAHTLLGEEDATTIVGSKGTLRSRGPGLNEQPQIELYTSEGEVVVPLQGHWFENGFQGTMGELLCAIEENREPQHSASNNLQSLALCFAAMESADKGKIVIPGEVRKIY